MMGFEIIGAFATIVAVLQGWEASRRGKRATKLQAIRDLSDAVAVTQQTITRGASGAGFPEVVTAWEKASASFAGAHEPKLSRLCQIKSLYWLEPSRWSAEQVHAAGIQLTGMKREVRRLISSLSPRKATRQSRTSGRRLTRR